MNDEEVLVERILKVRQKDRRYLRFAYLFVLDLVDYAREKLGREGPGEGRHLSPSELIAQVGPYARESFGPMADIVLTFWGVQKTDDLGEIVFNLIDAELLSKSPDDTRYEFATQVPIAELLAQA